MEISLDPKEIINEALDHGRRSFYWLLSGGKDSMSVTHFVAENYPEYFKGVLYVDTTIALDETKEFIKDECQRLGWKLHTRLPPRQTFEEWVKQYGFPSMRIHTIIMRRLKYEAMRKFALERLDEYPCMISGVRRKESIRRMGNVKEPFNHDGNLYFVAPFIDKSTVEVYNYLSDHGLKKSPAYTELHISGDCLCGSFAGREEIMLLKAFYPKIYEKIKRIEEAIKDDPNIKPEFKTWGNHHGAIDIENQTTLDALICGECAVY